MATTIRELQADRAALIAQANTILDGAQAEKRELSTEERGQFDALRTRINNMAEDINRRQESEDWLAQTGLRNAPSQTNMVAAIGMSKSEISQYSIVRAIDALAASRGNAQAAAEMAGLEMEASRAVAQQLGRAPQGFFLPMDVQMHEYRDIEKGGTASGAQLVATDKLSASFIDVLRNKMVVRQAGAVVLGGLVGDVSIPKKSSTSTAYWVAEGNAPTESNLVTTQVSLTPKTVGAWSDFTRKMLKQSSIDVEMMVRDDLAGTLQVAIDFATLHGSGSANNQPLGVAGVSGITTVYASGSSASSHPDGYAPAWADVVNLEAGVAVQNADMGALAFITNPKVRGKYRQTQIAANLPMVWPGSNELLGYPAYVTNQASSTLSKGSSTSICSAMFFGNWGDLVIGTWGALDILVDPYTASSTGSTRVVAFMDVDVAVRHAGSFAACLDLLAG